MNDHLVIGLVGPCKSGKSVLKLGLEQHGYKVKHIAQEHSFAPTMWQKIANPDVLIFLDVSYQETLKRGKSRWTEKAYNEQYKRLAHAIEHADLRLNTSNVESETILLNVLNFLDTHVLPSSKK